MGDTYTPPRDPPGPDDTVRASGSEQVAAGPPGNERLAAEHPGRYELKAEQGRGGMGRIFLAFDTHLGRDVALKELLAGCAGAVDEQRFLREARITGRLEHPNIVPVHEVGRTRAGSAYYTMRLVRGRTLAEELARADGLQGRLRLLGPVWDLCKAVAFAHSRGVIHRDLKPQNVMVGEFGETVVLDWGLAKVVGETDQRAPHLPPAPADLEPASLETRAGDVVGTPAYMSPEQADGRVDEIDQRADVWGLGAILYELLTGRPPFQEPTALQTLEAVRRRPLAPVLAAEPRAPPELAAIAEKALRKDRSARYQAAKELADDVSSFMTGGRVRAHRYSAWDLVRRFAGEHKAALIATCAVLAAVLAALVVVGVSWRSERASREQAEAATAREQQQRLGAELNLAHGYLEKAVGLNRKGWFQASSLFAAASLVHNPAQVLSAVHDEAYARAHPESFAARAEAAAVLQLSRVNARLENAGTLSTGDVANGLAFSADGRQLYVSGMQDVRVWDLEKGRETGQLGALAGRTARLATTPDGRWLAVSDTEGTAVVWDVQARSRTLRLDGGPAHAVLAFSPDAALLASGGQDGKVRVWDRATGKESNPSEFAGQQIRALAFSADRRWLAVATTRQLALRELGSGQVVQVEGAPAIDAVFSPDGRSLVASLVDRSVRYYSLPERRLERTVWADDAFVVRLLFAGGDQLVTPGGDGGLTLRTARGEVLDGVAAHRDFIYAAAQAPDGRLLATGSSTGEVRLWRLAPPSRPHLAAAHKDYLLGLAYSPDGKVLASGSNDNQVCLWSTPDLSLLRCLQGHSGRIYGVAFSPDSRLVASGAADGTVRLADAGTGALVRTLALGATVMAVSFSPDGTELAVASRRAVRRFAVADGRELGAAASHQDEVHVVAYSRDGSALISGGIDGVARIGAVPSGEERLVLRGHASWVTGVDFSPDGRRAVTCGKDGLAIVWDAATGKELVRLAGHRRWVNKVRFSPDGRYLATASDDATMRVWDAASGEPLLAFPTSAAVLASVFAPDGRSFAYNDGNAIVVLPLDLEALSQDPARLLADAEKRNGRRLAGFDLE